MLTTTELKRITDWARQFQTTPYAPLETTVVSYPAPNRGIEIFVSKEDAEKTVNSVNTAQPADFLRPHILA